MNFWNNLTAILKLKFNIKFNKRKDLLKLLNLSLFLYMRCSSENIL